MTFVFGLLFALYSVVVFGDANNSTNNNDNSNSNSFVVNTEYGPIEGFTNGLANIWSSIPYAKPPVGELRFAAPAQPDSWSTTLSTKDDPPGCIQVCTLSWWACPKLVQEDCLYLNIYTPIDNFINDGAAKPVMVFMHGGDYLEGYCGGLIYNATYFVNFTDVIIVALNYRLGAQGFFYDETTELMGNYGYFDQVMALEWVSNNIAQFGGDPDEVTIFGQSAGAVSVATHLMNTSNSLFKAAIMESNPFGLPLRTTTTWDNLPNLFKQKAGCNILLPARLQLECLRNISADTLLTAQLEASASIAVELKNFIDLFMPWTPTIGTGVLFEQPIFAFQSGNYRRDIPIMSGVVRNEGVLFIYEAFPTAVSKLEYQAFLPLAFNSVADGIAVEKYYGSDVQNQSDFRPLLSEIATDGLFWCATRNVTAVIANDIANNAGSYMYHFNHVSSFSVTAMPNDPACWDEVCHGMELAYVFEPDLTIANASWTDEEWQLAHIFGDYWSGMASVAHKPGDGNPDRPVTWSPFGTQQYEMMFNIENGGGWQLVSDYDQELCAFWDSLSYNWVPKTDHVIDQQ